MPEGWDSHKTDETDDNLGPFEFVIVVLLLALMLAVTAFLSGCMAVPA
jgi:hypothetical protein